MKNWFEVDKEGLKALQRGKPKTFIINELVQNAWDENITFCKVDIRKISNSELYITVIDDSPEGFKDIRHAYTLFADTYKRYDPEKRGRFNVGEKLVISICNWAKVTTTKGTIMFNENGRDEFPDSTDSGSVIELSLPLENEKEINELIRRAESLLPPRGIKYIVNDKEVLPKNMIWRLSARLATEIQENNIMIRKNRTTNIDLIESDGQSWIYEMGIPITKTDCKWHIDVQQKIPLTSDRETVRPAFLQDLYAEVLNETHNKLTEDNVSDLWVRTGMKDDRIKKEAIDTILNKRFGDKFLTRNPLDPNANDEAVSRGYTLISGSQMSAEEWGQAKKHDLIQSSSDLFGTAEMREALVRTPTPEQEKFIDFATRLAKEFLGINIKVLFVEAKGSTTRADYNPLFKTLRFNLAHPNIPRFNNINWENLKLLYHELPHDEGNHTEHSYHDCITTLAGKVTIKALKDPKFFEVN